MTATIESETISRPWWHGGVLLGALVAAAFGLVLLLPSNGGTDLRVMAMHSARAQLQQGCAAQVHSMGGDATACADMVNQMQSQMQTSSHGMSAPMPMHDAAHMRAMCEQMMATHPGVDDPAQWCADMVAWMSTNGHVPMRSMTP